MRRGHGSGGSNQDDDIHLISQATVSNKMWSYNIQSRGQHEHQSTNITPRTYRF